LRSRQSHSIYYKNAERIKIISGERIVEELNKILQLTTIYRILLLYKTGLLDIILPELTVLNQVEEIEGQTHKNNFIIRWKS
jgi:tRNA nucleotidyltransferase (CCA-adding enzyme)